MIQKVVSIYDLKACVFHRPICAVNTGAAMRDFGDATKDEKSILCTHPEDFQLYEIGEFDDNTGLVTSLTPMKLLCSATDFTTTRVSPGVKIDMREEVAGNGAQKVG